MITVFLNVGKQKHSVGRLLQQGSGIFFQYNEAFIKTGLNISPLHLPLNNRLYKATDRPFNGLHGVFSDSIPDGWGLLLMDRFLRQKGVNVRKITSLDQLLYIGSTAMGALSYEPDYSEASTEDHLDLFELSQEASLVYSGKQQDILPELIKAGGSPGGARPKIVVGIKDDLIISGEGDLPEGYQGWIIKFHTSPESDEGLIEEVYARMLRLANINMPITQILRVQNNSFFAVKRFDRINNQRVHLHSVAGLVNADFRTPDFDYEKLIRLTLLLTKNTQDAVQVYRQMVFNILAHNQDDHSKNFSFLMDPNGTWRLSPAYDITYNYCFAGEQSMSVDGYGKNIPENVFYKLGTLCGLDQQGVTTIFSEIFEALSQWGVLADELGIIRHTKHEIQDDFNILFNQYHFMIA